MSVIGKDEKGRIWFKSDWFLSDITDAVDFKVADESFLWRKWFKLTAVVPYNSDLHGFVWESDGRGERYKVTPKYFDQIIGWYKSLQQASMVLESLMVLRVREMSLIDGSFK